MSDLAYYLKISSHLAGKLDIRDALESVKMEIIKIFPLDHLDVCLIDKDGFCNDTYEVGLNTSWAKSRHRVRHSPVRDILTSKYDYMITANAMEDDRYIFEGSKCSPIIKNKLRSRINVPMKLLGKTIGSLNCSSQEINVYNESNIEQVQNIADILTPYFYAIQASEIAQKEAIMRTKIQAREEGLRLGALSLTEALEHERKHIGMDLHDQTLADLTRIARDLKVNISNQDMNYLHIRIQDCIQGLREIIDRSMPMLLELFGFQHAIKTHLERALNGQSVTRFSVIDHTNNIIDTLNETTQIALFRITQEAINNAIKHANSSSINIVISISDKKELHIYIKDNGVEIPIDFKNKIGSGLSHMQTRAQLIGATLNIKSDSGTHVDIYLESNKWIKKGI